MWDVVVLGLGGVGSFALRAAAREIEGSVLGIEQFSRGHSYGSSHGKSRIYRKAYFEHPNYVPWVVYSIQEFQSLQEKYKDTLPTAIILETGVLLLVPESNRSLLDAAVATAEQHSIPNRILNAEDLAKEFPQFNYDHGVDETTGEPIKMIGLYEPGGGMVRPELAIRAALADAEEHEAVIWEHCKVLSLKELEGTSGVELIVQQSDSTTQEVILAKKVLLAAGAWTSQILPSYKPHLTVLRQLQTWMDIQSLPDPERYNGNPVSTSGGRPMPALGAILPGRSLPVYALPADLRYASTNDKSSSCIVDNEESFPIPFHSCIKLGIHGRRDIVEDPSNNNPAVSLKEVNEMEEAIRQTFTKEVGTLLPISTSEQPDEGHNHIRSYIEPCMYTMTKDEHFLVGVPNGFHNVCVVAGLSGHGFKMAPALGQILADSAMSKSWKQEWNADFCAPGRFGI